MKTGPAVAGLLAAVLLAQVAGGGCALRRGGKAERRIALLAVLPLEPAPEATSVSREQARAVTAQIYGVLAQRPELRFVPDLTVEQALRDPEVESAAGLVPRAAALGRKVGADAVLFGTVSRFRERVGGSLGAKSPASVAFELRLLDMASGEVIWRGEFDRTQQPLSANLLNFWMFWRGGARWWTASELSRLGVEELLRDLRRQVLD